MSKRTHSELIELSSITRQEILKDLKSRIDCMVDVEVCLFKYILLRNSWIAVQTMSNTAVYMDC